MIEAKITFTRPNTSVPYYTATPEFVALRQNYIALGKMTQTVTDLTDTERQIIQNFVSYEAYDDWSNEPVKLQERNLKMAYLNSHSIEQTFQVREI